MSLKKDENNKIIEINFSTFKKFIKHKKPLIHKKKLSNNLKVLLIFSMVFITLKTNKRFKELDKEFLIDVFFVIFHCCILYTYPTPRYRTSGRMPG